MSTILKRYYINSTIVEDIKNLTKNNPESSFLLDNKKPIFDVSPYLSNFTKTPKRLEKAFRNIGLYNITLIVINTTEYTYMGKASTGELLMFNINKNRNLSEKQRLVLALEDFIKKIKNKRFPIIEPIIPNSDYSNIDINDKNIIMTQKERNNLLELFETIPEKI